MKRMAAILAAMGISAAAFADGTDPIPGAQSYSPYGDVYVVQEYVVVPSDTIVLMPMQNEVDSWTYSPD